MLFSNGEGWHFLGSGPPAQLFVSPNPICTISLMMRGSSLTRLEGRYFKFIAPIKGGFHWHDWGAGNFHSKWCFSLHSLLEQTCTLGGSGGCGAQLNLLEKLLLPGNTSSPIFNFVISQQSSFCVLCQYQFMVQSKGYYKMCLQSPQETPKKTLTANCWRWNKNWKKLPLTHFWSISNGKYLVNITKFNGLHNLSWL